MYQRIVVPLDGSQVAELALPRAVEFARLVNAPIHLLRVADFTRMERYGPYALALEYASVEPVVTEEETASTVYLQEIAARLSGEGIVAEIEVRRGRTAREIVAAAKLGDLIVMASHGRGGLSRWLLGSVAEDVLRHATVPILLVRADVVAETGASDLKSHALSTALASVN